MTKGVLNHYLIVTKTPYFEYLNCLGEKGMSQLYWGK